MPVIRPPRSYGARGRDPRAERLANHENEPMLRVVVADDHPVFRRELAEFLDAEADIRIVATVQNGDELMDALGEHEVDAVTIDVHMPGPPLVALIRRIRESRSNVGVVVVSMIEHGRYRRLAEDAGADGYVVKSRAAEELAEALRRAHEARAGADRPSVDTE